MASRHRRVGTERERRTPPLRAALLLLCGILASPPPVALANEPSDWPIGRWELVHDPEGRPGDALEFLPDGEAISIWPDGTRVPGIYVVTPRGIKAVFSLDGRDIITIFHSDPDRRQLRIVTSTTGRESVYEKRR
jgi:hypothetical protein